LGSTHQNPTCRVYLSLLLVFRPGCRSASGWLRPLCKGDTCMSSSPVQSLHSCSPPMKSIFRPLYMRVESSVPLAPIYVIPRRQK
ncbi:hypothetical protein JMJ77_0002364, partial [Colletotrichum scovillei]